MADGGPARCCVRYYFAHDGGEKMVVLKVGACRDAARSSRTSMVDGTVKMMVQVREQCMCEASPARRKMVELWWPEAAAAAVEGGHGG